LFGIGIFQPAIGIRDPDAVVCVDLFDARSLRISRKLFVAPDTRSKKQKNEKDKRLLFCRHDILLAIIPITQESASRNKDSGIAEMLFATSG
jgi:hypothetical protein